jgi:hypothetical protein
MTTMSWFRAFVAISIAVAGCDGNPATPDAQLTCPELSARFAMLASQLGRTCDTDVDCALAGGKLEPDNCDCTPDLPAYPVNGAAYEGSEAQAVEREYFARCAAESGVCDQTPTWTRCEAHVCESYGGGSCLDQDAGP